MNEARDAQDLGTFSQLWPNIHTLLGADAGFARLLKGRDFRKQKPTVLRGRREEQKLEERSFSWKRRRACLGRVLGTDGHGCGHLQSAREGAAAASEELEKFLAELRAHGAHLPRES